MDKLKESTIFGLFCDKEQTIKARIGQGKFREKLLKECHQKYLLI